MEKINIAELLRDCPQGMELDCTIWDSEAKVFLKEVLNDDFAYPIVVAVKYNNIEYSNSFTKYGAFNNLPYCKCVIFPKGKNTWDGFRRPFKDGDIISDSLGTCIFKSEGRIKGTVDYYCGISFGLGDQGHDDYYYFRIKDHKRNPDGHYGNIVDYRLATEEEKQKLFQVIKDNGYKWNPETKTLEKLPRFKVGDRIKHISSSRSGTIVRIDDKGYYIDYSKSSGIVYISFTLEQNYELIPNKFDISTLKPFESKVLVRTNNGKWIAAFYSHYDNDSSLHYCVVGGLWYAQCIPYKGNEYLLNTTDDCNEYYKT